MAQGSLKRWTLAALIAASACAEPAKAPPPEPAIQASPPRPHPAPAPAIQASPPRPHPAPAPAAPVSRDACHAAPLQYLVGKPHTDTPVPVIPALRRVACSSCVMTHDYNPARQTIIFDSTSGLVTSVKCG